MVWRATGEPVWLARRTRRALEHAGLAAMDARGPVALAEELRRAAAGVWLVRAGAWPVAEKVEAPPASATARPLLALGAVLGGSEAAGSWRGPCDLERGPLPATYSAWLDATLAAALAAALDADLEVDVHAALARLRDARRARVVRVGALDVEHDEQLRIAEVVTSLQQGGAERVALDLATALPRQGTATFLAVLGRPTRAAFTPSRVAVLDWDRGGRHEPAAVRLATTLAARGIDVAHAHLLDAGSVRTLGARGVPVVVTLHNERPGWPAQTESLRAGDVAALVACSRAVEQDLRRAGLCLPCRTVWNGIDFGRFAGSTDAGDWRARLGFGPDDFVLLALANPRPQKRLERLPAILFALRTALAARGVAREARLVVAGSPSGASAEAAQARDALAAAADRLALGDHVRLVGSVNDVGPLLRASDVLVSTSAHEGLSLAQLEALACDRPVVTTDVGGAPEVATRARGVTLLPREATAAEFVPPLVALACSDGHPAPAHTAAAAHFALPRMAADYARLLRSAARSAAAHRGEGLLLVANNFSTGGAQSSARRLLVELHRRGVRVRAAVLQEQPSHPTPGRRALEATGVPVLAVPPPAVLEPAAAVCRLAEWVDAEPPAAVVMWNVIAQHKVLLADTLFDIPVFDVSPGEMYFESLDRYFAAPRPGLPYATAAEYGSRLAGVIVKYAAEAEAARRLGAPVHVIPNGIEVDGRSAAGERPRRGDADGRLRIGTLARLDPRKRIDRLLRALRLAAPRLPPHVLRIAGGPDPGSPGHADELRQLADRLSVEFSGEAEPAAFLPALDLFALVAEPAGCPNASLEAMALALPVVATDAGGMSEQIVDRVSGRLVPREDEHALAEALVELGTDEALRARLGAAGRSRVRERFSLQSMADAYTRVLLGR